MNPVIRPIQPADNPDIKSLVVETLLEFGISGEGFAGVDPELDDMHAAYTNSLSAMYVIEVDDKILGMGGFAPLAGTAPGTVAELRKMYFRPALRGLGMGQKLIDQCIKGAAKVGFEVMYLETVPAMKAAQALYQKHGFDFIEERMGDTGHSGCGVFMKRALNA